MVLHTQLHGQSSKSSNDFLFLQLFNSIIFVVFQIVATSMGLLLIWSVASIVYLIAVVIRRALFHPLSHIPEPFFASITYFYQFYYNRLCRNSSFYLQIEKLHQKYGPVVRISPHEVHLSDPAHHQTIHRVGAKFTKDPAYYRTSFASPLSMFTTQDNALHRARRSVLCAAIHSSTCP
jgi:hypothetical protein